MRRLSPHVLAALSTWLAAPPSCAGSPASGLWRDPPAGVRLLFSDEFNGPALDNGKWNTTFPNGERRHSDEDEIYVDRELLRKKGVRSARSPFSFRHGVLSITARRLAAPDAKALGAHYASGMITTDGLAEFKYGYFEMRARMPKGAGLWPAFWLMRRGDRPYAEIDVVEILAHAPGVAYATTHAGPDWATRRMQQARATAIPAFNVGFHTYGVDWNEATTTFYVDGKPTLTTPTAEELKAPMYLIIDLAVGGNWGEKPDPAAFPAKMRLDYVRVWSAASPLRPPDAPTP
jgi:beta-glucanase (GH16 family)